QGLDELQFRQHRRTLVQEPNVRAICGSRLRNPADESAGHRPRRNSRHNPKSHTLGVVRREIVAMTRARINLAPKVGIWQIQVLADAQFLLLLLYVQTFKY